MTPPFFGSKVMNLLVFFDFEPKKVVPGPDSMGFVWGGVGRALMIFELPGVKNCINRLCAHSPGHYWWKQSFCVFGTGCDRLSARLETAKKVLPYPSRHISLGRAVSCQHGAFSGVGAFVVSFVPAECPVGGGMWGIFGKPLKRAIRNTPGLHAVLTTCLRFFSALDSACVACCLFLLTGSHHVFIQIHTTCCCFP